MSVGWFHFFRVLGWFFGGILLLVGAVFLFFNLEGPEPRSDVALGMTFSSRYATDLGLDWRETYRALLDEVGVRKVRLPVYWDLVEREPGVYAFDDLDWQLTELEARGGTAILAIGQRVPRWPECFIPSWANESDEAREQALLRFLHTVVERYRDRSVVTTWQVENEPFLVFFGECPPFDPNFFDEEVAFVKSLDPHRPILTTDSGELSLWFRAARRGDIFGTTMYRKIYKPGFGYFTYPLGPNFFRTKEFLTRMLTPQERFIVIELQAEPWANGWVANVPLEEQFHTMDAEKLRDIVVYARRVGFPEIYLWGAEWWYWLKVEKHHEAVWDTAKNIFEESR